MVSYVSTRGRAGKRSFEEVLLAGLAEDGGLFVPESWPTLDLTRLGGLSYAETTAAVLAPFVEGCFEEAELLDLVRDAYAGFSHPAVTPLRHIDHDEWVMELFHGPTLAFKDLALQILGRMFERVLQRRGEHITIVGATSGDTGSAAIQGCADRDNMRICILHPLGRVTEVQRRQMTTVSAGNVRNLAVRGTFDDCQALVKAMFNDGAYRSEMRLAAVNSINWARLAAQAAYYVYAGLRLAQPLTFSVPTGNFGDVYAGYIAHRMGLPVRRLVVATNRNDILARFFSTGRYASDAVHPTMSPSMDIQVASNFERLLFEMMGRDGAEVARTMESFADDGFFELAPDRLASVAGLLVSDRVDEAETRAMIEAMMRNWSYVVDPHTAVGVAAGRRQRVEGSPLVTLATAHPAKFPRAMEDAAGIRVALPEPMSDLMEKTERFCEVENDLEAVKSAIRDWAA